MIFINIVIALIIMNVIICMLHIDFGKRRRIRTGEKILNQVFKDPSPMDGSEEKTKDMTQTQKDYNWLLNIIDSSNNDFQFDCIDKLIELYHQKHRDESKTDSLLEVRHKQWNFIHSILK